VSHRDTISAPSFHRLADGSAARACAMLLAMVGAWGVVSAGGSCGAEPPTTVIGDTASAGALASLPARGLAAAIAEAGRIEVP